MRERSIPQGLFGIGLALVLTLGNGISEAAQAVTGTVHIEVVERSKPLAGATVSAGGQFAATDASGLATLALPPGLTSITVTKEGYEPAMTAVLVAGGNERTVRLVLRAQGTGQDEGPAVASTRTGVRVHEQAVGMEIAGREKIEENLVATPGNILRSLDEIAGVRVQTTSPELGLAMIRIQGLRGQYTRLLSDGVPLYFDLPGGLAPVQIPPMDLDRIEVIEGGASALFGANALAGVVNLLSRRPGEKANREFLFSQSVPGATDGVCSSRRHRPDRGVARFSPARIGRTKTMWTTTAGRTLPGTRGGSRASVCSGTTGEGSRSRARLA